MKKTNSEAINKSYRQDIIKCAVKQYHTYPEYPWTSLPGYVV